MPLPDGKFEELAEVRPRFLGNRFGAAFAALMRRAKIVMNAVEADMQIRAATIARLAATGGPVEKVRSAALMTVAVGHHTRIPS
jgi:hypothetical protein